MATQHNAIKSAVPEVTKTEIVQVMKSNSFQSSLKEKLKNVDTTEQAAVAQQFVATQHNAIKSAVHGVTKTAIVQVMKSDSFQSALKGKLKNVDTLEQAAVAQQFVTTQHDAIESALPGASKKKIMQIIKVDSFQYAVKPAR